MPTLNWIGKEAVVNHHHDVPYRTLDKKYAFNNGETIVGGGRDAINRVSTENKIIHGDNLEALKALLPEYEGRIKCIYIDPPYNTGNENWVYNDNVNSPKIQKWLGQVVGKEAEDLSRHDKWLCMMYPRLKLLHQLLADDGAIFISIDDNEQANLKLLCDEIFGAGNFVGQWHWYRSATPPNLSYKIKKNLEYVLAYEKKKSSSKYKGIQKVSKSDDPITKPQNTFKTLTFPSGTINFKGIKDGVIKSGVYGTDKFPNKLLNDIDVLNNTNQNEVTFENRFIWVQEKLDEELAKGTTINCSKSLVISYKRREYDPEVPPNLIDESVYVTTTEESGKLLTDIFDGNKVFDYPKPPSLIEYLINFLCDKSSIILDSFAGSGTTAHAVLNLNKQDGGNRKFILVEMEDYAENITAERVRRVINGYGEGKNAVEGTGGSFSYYELGEPIFTDDQNLNESVGVEKLREYIWYSETRVPYCRDGVHTVSTGNAQSYWLGNHDGTDYYFYYEPDRITTLSHDTLNIVERKADTYVVYADQCVIDKEWLNNHHIIFKKIPRD
ncbi:MAG: site-specific DNA-methyltransferase, partial [Paludibacteraceae bacterium]|nr:site-specific DNA-methyltransferase [Paludibacteraceae bacterium]